MDVAHAGLRDLHREDGDVLAHDELAIGLVAPQMDGAVLFRQLALLLTDRAVERDGVPRAGEEGAVRVESKNDNQRE